jgi:hypothetical protein
MSGTRSNNKVALHYNKAAKEIHHNKILSDYNNYTSTYKENPRSKNQQQQEHELRGAVQIVGRNAVSGGRYS